jgi:hypothetical protein
MRTYSDEPTSLNYDDCLKAIKLIESLPPVPQIYYSNICGNIKTIKRNWKDRLFTFPWRPWLKTKIYIEPTIYKVGNNFVAHTSYKGKIENMLRNL